MRFDDSLPAINLTVSALTPGLDLDLLVVPLVEGAEAAPGFDLWPALASRISEVVASGEFRAKPGSLCFLNSCTDAGRSLRVVLAGLGPRATYTDDRLRRAATAAALAARDRKQARIGFALVGEPPTAAGAQAAAEGLALATFHGGAYKTDADAKPATLASTLIAPPAASSCASALAAAASRGALLGSSCNLARALANEPSNAMTPSAFARVATNVASAAGLGIEVLDETRLEALGMELMLGVARGSAERPLLVVLRYEPALPTCGVRLGLVGKGVTFDSGGICIKGSDGMFKMKGDMSGGAAVLAAMRAIAGMKPTIPVVGVIPLVENMPGGRALKPGDVLRSAEGKTVEVLDTDAEGRLILGDALWFARSIGATHLVDIATLTGAIGVALGRTTSGLFGAPDWWTAVVQRTATREGDRTWMLPLFDDYRDQLRSEIADFTNVGGRPAGSITAAMFLKEFSGGLPWAHLDIASTAWAEDAQPHQPKGPTGVGVRTLAELPFTAHEWLDQPDSA